MSRPRRSKPYVFWLAMLVLAVVTALPHVLAKLPHTSGPTTFQFVGPVPSAKPPIRGREVAPPAEVAPPPRPVE